jgi:hypothetical protein
MRNFGGAVGVLLAGMCLSLSASAPTEPLRVPRRAPGLSQAAIA